MTPRVAALVLGLVVTHLLLRVALGLGNEAPDLFLVAVLIGSRHLGLRAGAALGFILGLLEDAFSMLSFGATVFALTVLGAAGAHSRFLFVGNSVRFLVSYLALGKWVRELLAWVVSDPATRNAFGEHMLFESPLMAVYASIVGTSISRLVLKGPARP